MAIYNFLCSECGHTEEIIQPMSGPSLKKCPKCQKDSFKKQISSSNFQFKGNGFYCTDYKNKK